MVYEENIKRQKDLTDDLFKKIARLKRQNGMLERRGNYKNWEIQPTPKLIKGKDLKSNTSRLRSR